MIVRYWDDKAGRYRIAHGYVGEGLEKGGPYHVEGGKLVPGESAEAKAGREYAAKLSAMKPAERE